MTRLAEFRQYVQSHMMDLEAILVETYTALTHGRRNFALFDGGAHKGYHTTRMLALPDVARVIAVEADPAMFKGLEKILAKFIEQDHPRLDLVEKALQRHEDVTSIPWKSSISHVGRSSIISTSSGRETIWDDRSDMTYRDPEIISATTIDILTAPVEEPIIFIKLDLEGADLFALLGARKTLAAHRPVVAFENSVFAPKVHGFTLDEVAAFFESLGYVALNFIGERLSTSDWFTFFEAWAVPQERVSDLEQIVNEALLRRNL